MSIMRAWWTRLWHTIGLGRRRSDLDAELQCHLDLHIDDNIRSGMSPADARREALLAFGPVESVRETFLDQHTAPALRTAASTLRQASRSVTRHAGLSAVVVLTLGVGVGVTAALAGVADALLFRPPDHVAAPDRLVEVLGRGHYPRYLELAEHAASLKVAAVANRVLSMEAGDSARALETQCVTASYIPLMGASPVAGRAFAPDEDREGAARVVILSHHVWQSEFGGASEALGRMVRVAGIPHQIIGVAPADFRGLRAGPVDAWISLAAAARECSISGVGDLYTTSGSWLSIFGRLRDGVTLAQADSEVGAVAPADRRSDGADPVRHLQTALESRADATSRDRRLSLWLAAGAALVLLIAAASATGLLIVRAIERQQEMNVRMQLGATRVRLALQLTCEHLLLTVASAGVAWLVAGWIGSSLRAFMPVLVHHPWLDGRALGLLAFFVALAGTLSAATSLLHASRTGAVLERVGSLGSSRTHLRHTLLTLQVALTLMLSVGAGLFAHSVLLAKNNVGYDIDRVIVATIDLDRAGIRRLTEKRRVFDAILERLSLTPGLEAVALSTTAPLGSGQSYSVTPGGPPGTPPGSSLPPRTLSSVSAAYFKVMGTRLIEGRAFSDDEIRTGRLVAIVDVEVARETWPGQQVVGRCLAVIARQECSEIVGLTESRRSGSLRSANREIFFPLTASTAATPQAILIRPAGSVEAALPGVAAAIRTAIPDLPFVNLRPLEELANTQTRSWRLGAWLFGLFGSVGLFLSAIGLYSSLSFTVRERSAEIGVRMALGAGTSRIVRLIVTQGMACVAAGWALGLAGTLAAVRSIEHLLFGVTVTDWPALAGASVALGTAGLLGCVVPAIRASLIDPVKALRAE